LATTVTIRRTVTRPDEGFSVPARQLQIPVANIRRESYGCLINRVGLMVHQLAQQRFAPARCTILRRRAFTLLEMLVAIGVMGILLAMILPAVAASREAARKTQCANNLHQIGVALHNYHDVFSRFPAGASSANQLSWHVSILPQLEQANLYAKFNFAEGDYYDAEKQNGKNNPHGLADIYAYRCPSSSRQKSLTSLDKVDNQHSWTTHYYGIMGPRGSRAEPGEAEYEQLPVTGLFASQGLLTLDLSRAFADITDGTSNTFVVGELSWNDAAGYRTWVRGNIKYTMSGCKNVISPIGLKFMNEENDFNDLSLGSEHTGGTHVLAGDGSIRFLHDTIDLYVYKALASINGGETATFPD
jgi:prepilin-type N-terminal cleavage/methylation domain-containing protein